MSKKFVLRDDNESEEFAKTLLAKTEPVVVTANDLNNKSNVDTAVYDTFAFTIALRDGAWSVGEAPMNSKTSKLGEWNWVKDDGSKVGASNLFKLQVYKAGLMNF